MKRALAAAAQLLTATFAFAGLQISPELPAGTPVYSPLRASPWNIASDGSEFLVSWGGSRLARISPSGEVLDPYGVEFPSFHRDPYNQRLVWTGKSYAMVWHVMDRGIIAMRIDRETLQVEEPRFLISTPDRSGLFVNLRYAVAGNSQVLVVYDLRAPQKSSLRAALFDRDLKLQADVELSGNVSVASIAVTQSDGFFIFWGQSDGLQAARIDARGRITSAADVAREADLGDLSLAASDGRDVLFVHVRKATAVLLDGATLRVKSVTKLTPYNHYSFVFWSGEHYVLAGASNNSHIVIDRIARDGTYHSEIAAGGPIRKWSGVIAGTSGSDLLMAWEENSSPFPTMTQVVSIKPPHLREIRPLALRAPTQLDPAVAFDPAGMFAVTWSEGENVFATRITPAGRSLDGRGVHTSQKWPRSFTCTSDSPTQIAFDGRQFALPAVALSGAVLARFLSSAAGFRAEESTLIRPPSPSGFWNIADPCVGLTTAAGQNGAMVVWTGPDRRVLAAEIGRETGSLLTPPVVISPPLPAYHFEVGSPVVAWNGSEYLFAWIEHQISGRHWKELSPRAVRAARVSADLQVRDVEPLTVFDRPGFHLSIASNGKDWLVGTANHVREVLADGTLSEMLRVDQFKCIQSRLRLGLAWDGERYVIAWKEAPTVKLAYLQSIERGLEEPVNLSGARSYEDQRVSVAAAGPNRVAVAYSRVAPEEPYYGTERVFLRIVTRTPEPQRTRAVR